MCNYSAPDILVEKTIKFANTAAANTDANNNNMKFLFKNIAPFASVFIMANLSIIIIITNKQYTSR